VKSGIIEKMTIPTNIHVPEVVAIPGVDNTTKNFDWFRHRPPPKKGQLDSASYHAIYFVNRASAVGRIEKLGKLNWASPLEKADT
jgi:hypothetical protein